MYFPLYETSLFKLQSSRLGDVIATHIETGKEVYFQPGDAGSEMLAIVEENPPSLAMDIFLSPYFDGVNHV